jgi:hypothetical protein
MNWASSGGGEIGLGEEANCMFDFLSLIAPGPAKLTHFVDEGDSNSGTHLYTGYPNRGAVRITYGYQNGPDGSYENAPEYCELVESSWFTECLLTQHYTCAYTSNWVKNCQPFTSGGCPPAGP